MQSIVQFSIGQHLSGQRSRARTRLFDSSTSGVRNMGFRTGSNRRRGGRALVIRASTRAMVESLEYRTLLSTSTLVYPGPDGRLVYTAQADGDQIPDFSYVGYMTGNVPLPDTTGGVSVPVKQTINPGAPGVDMHNTIQNAINAVAALSPDANGFRGAIQLTAGNYPISGTLNINTSGIVLIGDGNDPNTGTRLEATGTTASDARILINVNIADSSSRSTVSNTTHNIQGYVPVGAKSFTVDSTANLHVGDTVIVHRPSTTNWLHDIGMDTLTNPWTAGSRDIDSDRTITAINGNTITIDAPITNALDPQYGGGTIHGYTWSARISKVGLMNMYTYSDWVGGPSQPDTDTTHATGVASFDRCVNCWVENLTADNFATNILNLGADTKWTTIDHVTIQNTSQAQSNINDAPSGIGGTQGTLNLCENITLTNAYHAISAGGNVAGPNVYTNITITDPLEGALNLPHSRDETGPHQRYSTGGLFDDVSNTDWVNIRNAGNEGSGHGWQGANYVLWNVNARTDVSSPPTAQNWIIGGTASTSEGTGIYDQRNTTVFPLSLYQTQLWDRLHPNDPTAATAAHATPNPLNGSTSVSLSVLGAETGLAESNLTYTWGTVSKPNGSTVSFGANGTNVAKNTTATLSQTGTYIFTVTITDPGGLLTTSTVVVTPTASTVINGDQDFANENDVIRIVRNGSFVDVFRNNPTTPVLHQDYATSPELVIEGLGGSDTITVDYSGGNPVPAAGLVVDGGTGTSDVVSVVGTTSTDAVTLASGGSVTVNGGQFGYTNFEEMDLSMGGGIDTLTASGNASVSTSALVLTVGGGGSLTMSAGSTLPNFTDLTVNGATFDLGGTSQTVDAFNGNASGVVQDTGSAATFTVGQNNSGGTFAGVLRNGTGTLSFTKSGSGSLTLSGNNSYTGVTNINGGEIASGNAASLATLAGQIQFNGGTFHVTANMAAPVTAIHFTTSFTGATGSSTGTFNIDAGVTLTIGTLGGPGILRTNGGGAHGGDFTKTGAGTLDILAGNGQQDNIFHLAQGTLVLEVATAAGGGDSGVEIDASNGTTLVLKQDASTNFLTPLNVVDAGGTVNVTIDRQSSGAGVTHQLNTVSSAGAFTLNVTAGANVATGTAGFTLGTLTLGGNGTINVGMSALMTVTGVVSGGFTLTKSGSGGLTLNAVNTYSGDTTVNGGTMTIASGGSIASANITVAGGAALNVNGSVPSSVAITDSGTVNFAGNVGTAAFTRSIATLNVQPGGLAAVLPSQFPMQPAVLNVTSLTLTNATSKLDLTNNELRVTAAESIIRGDIAGHEMFTSASGGVVGDIDLGNGQTEARYTLVGDTNLDGTVNVTDLSNMAGNFGKTSGGTWASGDMDYNNTVNVADLSDLASNFGSSLASGLASGLASAAAPAAARVAVAAPAATTSSPSNIFSDDVILDLRRHRHRRGR
jgi:autotransporter-associated beta strand protein